MRAYNSDFNFVCMRETGGNLFSTVCLSEPSSDSTETLGEQGSGPLDVI